MTSSVDDLTSAVNRNDPLPRLADLLEAERDALVASASATIFGELDSYRDISREVVERSLAKNVTRATETLRDGYGPDPGTEAEAATTTRERAEQGVPIEDILRAYRISLRYIHDRFVELAGADGVPAEAVLRGANLLWMVGDWFTARAAIQYQSRSIDSAVRRASLLGEVLNGLVPVDVAALAELGLDPSAAHAVAVGVPTGDLDRLRRAIERSGALPARPALVGQVGDLVVGVVPGDPLPSEAGVIAVGPHVPLSELRASAALATRVLALVGTRESGRYGVADVSWRLAANSDVAVTAHLRATYIAPFEPLGDFGALLLDSVRAFLACNRSVRDASIALGVHENTLRYRLLRFEETVGVSLQETDALVEVSWALESYGSA